PSPLIRDGGRGRGRRWGLIHSRDRDGDGAMSWAEVTELVLRAQTGDRAAYGELVRRFEGAVYAMALQRVRDPGEAQELAQEVFVHGMRKLPQLRDPRCFAGWLRRITARMAINRLSRRGVRPGSDPEVLDGVAAVTADPLKAMARAFGTPVGTIKRRLHVARQRLKEALEGPAPRPRRKRELACV